MRRLFNRSKTASSGDLTPLIVASSGRSGTTVTMQLLATSPSIVFDRVPPYENAYLSYFIQWSRVIDQGKQQEGPWRRAALDHSDYVPKHGLVGALPWLDRPALAHEGHEEPFRLSVLRDVWSRFSAYAVANQRLLFGDPGLEPLYYAETAPIWVVEAARHLGPVKAMYLIRDPRDQYLSILSFIRQRGRRSFGYQEDDTPESFAASFAKRQLTVFRTVIDVEESADALVLRYESLVTRPEVESEGLAGWLGVDLDWAKGLEVSVDDHLTSPAPESSVGRWRHEMQADIKAIFHDTMAKELEALGYDI